MEGFVPNFMGRFLGKREDQVHISLRSIEGCGSNGQKTRQTGDCLHFILLIVDVASVGDKTPQISLSRGVVLCQSTFHLVLL